ncbi:hypothetical protein RHGRI_007029 [Rhododendron griersonianum]|uniref:Pyruvate kinase n=1 Tax=Rhododendron griersonianum TaxID=479676 RepID=A0AAV6KVS3_9ERIC|nr:hypothetical protein RHGRI_007029 [Rhododendron griersonianum]
MVCVIKNTATLTGSLFTLHASQVHIDLPTLSDKDKENLCMEFACFSSLLAIKMKATAFMIYFHFDALLLECGVDISQNFVCEGILLLVSDQYSFQVISTWGVKNKIDFLSLSYTRHAEDVREAQEFLSKLGDLSQTHIFAKIENVEGLTHFDEILQEADLIILSWGNLGIDLPSEKDDEI